MTLIEILPYLFSIVTLLVGSIFGYYLGLKSQRIQAKRKYVADVVRDKYPALSSEIIKNIDLFDYYLEDPLEHFDFPRLDQFYDDGYNEFMKKHHTDLFLSVDYLKHEITPKLYELRQLVEKSIKKIFENWDSELYKILPNERKKESRKIADDLIRSIGPNYVFKDLLNERKDAVKEKIEAVILDRTAHIHPARALDYDKIFNSLLKTAKPEIARVLELYTELHKQIDEKVKSKLLPLLHKYISNPYD